MKTKTNFVNLLTKMELDEYKEMSNIVIRQINNSQDEVNKVIGHEKKNKTGKPLREI